MGAMSAMPNFTYQAVDDSGREVEGTIYAENTRTASARVRELGYFPTEIQEAQAAAATQKRRPSLWTRVTAGDVTVMTRQLANLLGAGMTVLRSLNVLIENTDNERLQQILEEVRDEVQAGGSLWETLGKHPRAFPELYVNMIRAGEASGELEAVTDRLADFLERQQQQRARIRSAMAYPILLITVGSAAVFFLITFLIPRFSQIFEDFGQALPTPTRVLLAVSYFLGHYWWAVLGGLVALVLLVRAYIRTPGGTYLFDSLKLRMPAVGKLTQRLALSRFSRTLATLLHGGVGVLEAFTVVKGAIGCAPIAAAIDAVYGGVREGESIAEPLRRTGAFTPLVTNMIAVGEETGDLEGMLNKIADSYDLEVQNITLQLISLLEPLIILVMGVIVGSVVISMLLPIFEMNVFAQ